MTEEEGSTHLLMIAEVGQGIHAEEHHLLVRDRPFKTGTEVHHEAGICLQEEVTSSNMNYFGSFLYRT